MSPLKEIPEDSKGLNTIESHKIQIKRNKILEKIPERVHNSSYHNTSNGFNSWESYGQDKIENEKGLSALKTSMLKH